MTKDDWPEQYELASEAVKNCAESIVAERDVDKETAFAICQDMENKGQLTEPDDSQRENQAGVRLHRGLGSLGTDTVRRVENDDGSVTYKNLAILAPGEWTDAASETTLFYSPEAIQRIAEDPDEHVVETSVNVNHENQDQLKQVGSFDPSSLTTDDQGVLYSDLTLHGRTQASEDTIGLVDLALETEGEQGAGGPSVEIPREGEQTEWDRERGMERMVQFDLGGLAIVTRSASEDVGFENQFAERAIAMSDGDEVPVRVMQASESAAQTLKTGTRHGADMSDDQYRELKSDIESIQETVDDLQGLKTRLDELLDSQEAEPEDEGGEPATGGENPAAEAELEDEEPEEPEHELQDMEAVGGFIEQFNAEHDVENATVADFINWAQEAGADVEAIEDVVSVFMQDIEAATPDEAALGDLQAFIEEQAGGEEAPEEEEEQREESELASEVEELRRELDELKDEPEEPRSLAETPAAEAEESGGGEPVPMYGGLGRDGEYYGR